MSYCKQSRKDAALDQVLVASVSLAAGIASNHPAMGQCQLDRLRSYGVSPAHLDAIVEIARHIRDEAAEKLDYAFDQKASAAEPKAAATGESCGCTPTAGQSLESP